MERIEVHWLVDPEALPLAFGGRIDVRPGDLLEAVEFDSGAIMLIDRLERGEVH